jgi:hypothetical protein
MDILEKRFRNANLTKFELALNRLGIIDKQIVAEIKSAEKDSFIVTHKKIFFKQVEIDHKKINLKLIKDMIERLELLAKAGAVVLEDLSKGILTIHDPSGYDPRLERLFKKEVKKIMVAISKSRRIAADIHVLFEDQEFHAEFKKYAGDYLDDFKKLDVQMSVIRTIVVELEHYSEFWKKRNVKGLMFPAKKVIRTSSYVRAMGNRRNLRKRIFEIEERIETLPGDGGTHQLNGMLRRVVITSYAPLKGKHPLHAWIGDSGLRMIYCWDSDNKVLVFLNIKDKDQMNMLRRI